MSLDDELAKIREHARHAAEADQRQESDMPDQRGRGGGLRHAVTGLRRPAAAMLSGTRTATTSGSDSFAKAKPAKAKAAHSMPAGRARSARSSRKPAPTIMPAA